MTNLYISRLGHVSRPTYYKMYQNCYVITLKYIKQEFLFTNKTVFEQRNMKTARERKYLNSLHLARKYARIFVFGHYLFREENSRGTDYVQGQIYDHIFPPNGGYCVYYPSNLFRNARSLENWEYLKIRPVARP